MNKALTTATTTKTPAQQKKRNLELIKSQARMEFHIFVDATPNSSLKRLNH